MPRFFHARRAASAFVILMLTLSAPTILLADPILDVSKDHILLTSLDTGAGGFLVLNVGDPGLVWTASVDKPWVSINPTQGNGPNVVGYSADLSVPSPHETATITIDSNGGAATVEIEYRILPPVNGTVGIYADPAGVDCNIIDAAPGLLTVHVVHTATAGAAAIQLWAPMPACMVGATWLADTPAFPVTIGNSQVGVSAGFGACLVAPILVTSISYMVSGQTPACCAYPALGDPGAFEAPHIINVDCNENKALVSGATTVINGDASCPCMLTVRTEETTWGKVKSLYASDPAD